MQVVTVKTEQRKIKNGSGHVECRGVYMNDFNIYIPLRYVCLVSICLGKLWLVQSLSRDPENR